MRFRRPSQRRLVLGAIAWALAVQFFVAQGVVQCSWTTPFSLARNYISDLGNTSCGWFDVGTPVYVCSPWHAWMNASFILLGMLTLVGAGLVGTALAAGRVGATGLLLIALAGPGDVAVGLFPEDVNLAIHEIGAGLHFIGGNLGLILLGAAMVRGGRQTDRRSDSRPDSGRCWVDSPLHWVLPGCSRRSSSSARRISGSASEAWSAWPPTRCLSGRAWRASVSCASCSSGPRRGGVRWGARLAASRVDPWRHFTR